MTSQMKTILDKMRIAARNDATLEHKLANIEIVAPRFLPPINQTDVPFLGLAGLSSSEQWVSSDKKDAEHTVEAYLVWRYLTAQDAIIGSEDGDEALFDMVEHVNGLFRGSFLPDDDGTIYLSKPIDITELTYSTEEFGDGYYLFVATTTYRCIRQFLTT